MNEWRSARQLGVIQRHMKADPGSALLLFASPRGGSSWLEEMLATVPRSASIWEPLDIRNNPAFGQLGFWWRQHIPENEEWPEAEALFARLFSGKLLSPFLTQSTTHQALEQADRLVVKLVRGNLLLPWLTSKFALPKPVLLVRHPCAVVASMIDHGGWEKIPPAPMDVPPHRHDHLLGHYVERSGDINTIEERFALNWCVDNAFPLSHPLNGKAWTTITYEDLVLDPEGTLGKIFEPWGIPVPERALQMARQPSRTVRPGSPVGDPEAQLELWRKKLDADQQDRILAMVERMGITLYGRDLLPLRAPKT